MTDDINIIDAYVIRENSFIIFISGLQCCGKTTIAKYTARDFEMVLIDQFNYFKKDYDVKSKLNDDLSLINWDSDDAIDWEKFNADIQSAKLNNKKVVVVGFALVDDKIKIKPNIHIHLVISKQKSLEKKRIFLEKNKEKYPEEFKEINTPIELLKMNKFIFPYYLATKERSKIQKFINVNDIDNNQIYDQVFNIIVDYLEDRLYENNPEYKTRNDLKQLSRMISETTETIELNLDELSEDTPLSTETIELSLSESDGESSTLSMSPPEMLDNDLLVPIARWRYNENEK
jgi:hypothetical protein